MGYTFTGMALCAVVALTAGLASAQAQPPGGQIVYPAKGQSEEQQTRDKYECHQFAVKESAFDPTAPAAASPAPAAPPARSGAAGGAVRGAARGAAAGAVARALRPRHAGVPRGSRLHSPVGALPRPGRPPSTCSPEEARARSPWRPDRSPG